MIYCDNGDGMPYPSCDYMWEISDCSLKGPLLGGLACVLIPYIWVT
jgi:hypothetical protein